VLCVTLLLISIDNTILNVALPSIVRGLHATSSQLQWTVDAYAVVFAGLLLSLGALGDRVGRKWVFMAGLAVFGGGSAFSAWSGSPDRLIIARACMGVGAAAIMPSTLSILTNVFTTDRDRARAIGIWSGTTGLGVAIGPILGGFLLDHFWWGSVFLINVPIAIAGLIATLWLVPNSCNGLSKRPDPLGALLSMTGLGLWLWAIIEAPNRSWTSPLTLGALGGGAVATAAFVWWERRCDHPMLPLAFFRNRRFSAAISSLALVLFALLGMFFLMTQYLQFSLGFSPLQTGLRVAPIALVLLVAAPLSVLLARSRRLGTKPVVGGGMLLIAVGLGLLSRTSVQSTYTDLLPAFLLIGIGVGLALAPSTESVMGSLPAAEAGVGSATDDTALQIGGALGVGVLGTLLNAHYRSQMSAFLSGSSIPGGVRRLIVGSVGGAQAVAQRVPGPFGHALSSAARTSFVSGMDHALIVAAVVVGVAAIVVLAALPNRGMPTPTAAAAEFGDRQGEAPATGGHDEEARTGSAPKPQQRGAGSALTTPSPAGGAVPQANQGSGISMKTSSPSVTIR
jgi:EmrB/QacA subfamily drug resistance transporter